MEAVKSVWKKTAGGLEYDVATCTGTWSSETNIIIKSGPLAGKIIQYQCMVSGCGLATVGNIVNIGDFKALVEFLQDFAYTGTIDSKVKKGKQGQVLVTLGKAYWDNYHKLLIDAGFVQLAEYENLQHEKGYRQRLYGLEIKRK